MLVLFWPCVSFSLGRSNLFPKPLGLSWENWRRCPPHSRLQMGWCLPIFFKLRHRALSGGRKLILLMVCCTHLFFLLVPLSFGRARLSLLAEAWVRKVTGSPIVWSSTFLLEVFYFHFPWVGYLFAYLITRFFGKDRVVGRALVSTSKGVVSVVFFGYAKKKRLKTMDCKSPSLCLPPLNPFNKWNL